MFTKKNKWLMLDDFLEKYSPYRIANLGSRYINPNDIIGFSLTEEEILNSGKLDNLNERIMIQGWKPIHLRDFELILLPNGKYTVGNGGNHRSYLAKQLKKDSIPAYLEVLIPEKNISEWTDIKIKELELEQRELNNKARILNDFLKQQGIKRSLCITEEEELHSLYSKSDLKNDVINQLLLIEAKNLGYLSNELLEGNM